MKTKRVYDEKEPGDGYRVLVMRMWPRGVAKDTIDCWEKELGTPKDLIKDWKSGSIQWREFVRRYKQGIRDQKDKIKDLARRSKDETVTLLCGCKDENRCHRSILKGLIDDQARSQGR